MTADDLAVSCRITTPSGEMELNDGRIYKLGSNTKSEIQVTWRRSEVSGPFVPGSWTVNAVEDTISENVEVYVYGNDHGELRRHLDELTKAFSQHYYTITWDYTEDVYSWYCQYADYAITTSKEFQHARMALAKFSVPRYPALIRA